MISYTIANGLRVVCVLLCLFVQGWWLALCITGAIILPYVAVVIANATDARVGTVQRPSAIVPYRPVADSRPDADPHAKTDEPDADPDAETDAPDSPREGDR